MLKGLLRLAGVLLLAALPLRGATTAAITTDGSGASHVGTTIITALGYPNPAAACTANSVCYVGTTITITGSLCTSGVPCSWTLKDQNSDTVSTVSTTAQQGAVTPLGRIDCTGSAANLVCLYSAPVEYPSTQVVTIGISDGSTSATVTVNFSYINGLNEYWVHLGRTRLVGTALGINNIPWNIYSLGGSPITYSPTQTNFLDTYITPNIEAAILSVSSDTGAGLQLPATAGSDINRPAFSFDGRWIHWASSQQIPAVSSSGLQFVQHVDGTAFQLLSLSCWNRSGNAKPMWEKNNPSWLLTVDSTHLSVCDVGNAQTVTTIATHGLTNPATFTYENGLTDNLFPIRTQNAGACNPILTSCSVTTSTFDISPCYVSLTATCATATGSTFNSFLNAPIVYDATGVLHCGSIDTGTAPGCEWHYHDIWFVPRTISLNFIYGFISSVGEPLYYQIDVNGDPATLQVQAPNPSKNIPYWSHPAFNHSNAYLVSYSGLNGCAPLVSNVCQNTNTGSVVWDLRTGASIFFDPTAGVNHIGWDGFYVGYFVQDAGAASPGDIINGCYNRTLSEMNVNAGPNARRIFQTYGCRPSDVNGPANTTFFGPAQSPDSTKYAYSMSPSQQLNTTGIYLGWMYFAHKPAPPVNVTLSGTASALLQWTPSPLSFETHLYWLYKQASCAGAWTRLTSVTGVFRQFTNYTVTDGALGSGTNACYGLTTQEWSGQESDHLSNIVKITNTAGVFSKTQMAGEGTINFAPAGPSDVGSLAVAQKLLCATICPTVSLPTVPLLSASGTGITGQMWGAITYVKFLDFPANTVVNETLLSDSASVTLTNQGMRWFSLGNEMVGQDAVRFYMSGPSASKPASTTFHLQTSSSCDPVNSSGTVAATTVLINNNQSNTGSRIGCIVTSFNGASAAPPVTNTAIGGYLLTWTDPGGLGDRYEQIYYREGAAVVLSQGEVLAQQYLIGTVPIGSLKFYDAFPNQATAATNVHYAVVVKRMDGTRSTGICMKGDGSADTCL